MNLKSLAFQSDLQLIAETGRVDERPGYVVARTPENPGFVWGNFILMPRPPVAGERPEWERTFQQEFGHEAGLTHICFGWDGFNGEEGASGEWVAAGYGVERSDVMVASSLDLVLPQTPMEDLELRPLDSDEDWKQALELQILCRGAGFDPVAYRDFKTRRMRMFRRLVDENRGRWYGAFHGAMLVGDLGIFSFDGLARFQLVETHPDHRRKGVCRNLLHFASHEFFLTGDAEKLLIVAEENSPEARLYTSVGFKTVERQRGVSKVSGARP